MELFNDEYFMRQALQEAEQAFAEGEIPVATVVVSQNRIIVRAHNLTETLTEVTAHAEMQAITAAANLLGGKYLNECTLFVTLEHCVICAGALGRSQIGKAVFIVHQIKNKDSISLPRKPCMPELKEFLAFWKMNVLF